MNYWFNHKGVLADKFQCYKLILILVVAFSAIFHTLLLHVDARISPDVSSSVSNWEEIPAEVICGRTGAFVHFENFTCDDVNSRHEWTIELTPSHCRPVGCDHKPAKMSLCLLDGNCTQITIGSTSSLEMDVLLETIPSQSDDNCTRLIVNAKTDQTGQPAWLLCNCSIRCPVIASAIISPESNISIETNVDLLEIREAERLKHNRGFWFYFVFRIFASGLLSTSFSM